MGSAEKIWIHAFPKSSNANWSTNNFVLVLYCILQLYYAYTNIHGNIINCNDDFNKRTNTLLYKNISLTLYFRKGDVCCVWEMSWRQGYIDPISPLDHSSTASSSWPGCSTVGHWGPQSPQSASWFSRWHPVSDWLESFWHLVILLSNVHLLPLLFRLFTPVNLLIDGPVEGQYITLDLNSGHRFHFLRL